MMIQRSYNLSDQGERELPFFLAAHCAIVFAAGSISTGDLATANADRNIGEIIPGK